MTREESFVFQAKSQPACRCCSDGLVYQSVHLRDLEDPLRDNGSLNVPDQRDTTTKKGVQFGIMTAIAIESWIHPFGSTLTSP